jgi:AsmA protein
MLKKITYAFIGLLLLLVAVALVVPLFLNPESMKAPMLRQIEAMTGYKVNVAGDVSVRLLPSARLRLADVSITSSLSAENDKPFAKARELDVGVKLLPLLSGKVEITRLALQNPELTLVQSAGKNNWQTKPAMTKPATTESAKTNGDAAVASAILLQAFEISDGALSYKNTQTGQQVVMSGLNVEAGMRALDAPFTFAAKTVWNGKPAKLKLTLDSLAAVLNNNQSPLVFSFASDGLSADLKGLLDPLKFSGALAIKSDSVMQAIAWLSGAKPVADALPVKLDIKGESVCALNNCGLNNATIQVNDTLLLGSIKANMAGARPEIAADFSTKLLDMTPYLAKKNGGV